MIGNSMIRIQKEKVQDDEELKDFICPRVLRRECTKLYRGRCGEHVFFDYDHIARVIIAREGMSLTHWGKVWDLFLQNDLERNASIFCRDISVLPQNLTPDDPNDLENYFGRKDKPNYSFKGDYYLCESWHTAHKAVPESVEKLLKIFESTTISTPLPAYISQARPKWRPFRWHGFMLANLGHISHYNIEIGWEINDHSSRAKNSYEFFIFVAALMYGCCPESTGQEFLESLKSYFSEMPGLPEDIDQQVMHRWDNLTFKL